MKQCLHYKGKKCKIILFCRTLIFNYVIRSLKHNIKCQQLQNANIDTKIHLPFFTIKFKCSLKTSVLDKENRYFIPMKISGVPGIFVTFVWHWPVINIDLNPTAKSGNPLNIFTLWNFLRASENLWNVFCFFCFSIFDCASLSINYDTWLHGRIYGIKIT